jgi:GNAT superfamily N-acetyltransferase
MPSDAADIRVLESDDLHGALALSTAAGWNQRLEDWRLLNAIATRSLAASWESRVVGTAIAIDYGAFAWIAMMLVEPAHRGRGLGARLLEAAMGAIPPERPIRLDATPVGRHLYLKYGFADEAILTRSVSPAGRHSPQQTGAGPVVRALTAADLPGILRYDADVFGADRAPVLAWALEQAPEYAHMVEGGTGALEYTFGRPGRLFEQVGPVVARRVETARALVGAAMRSARDRPVVVDAFDARGEFTAWLRECGFAGERPLYRMRRPPQDVADPPGSTARSSSEFAIFGPDLA